MENKMEEERKSGQKSNEEEKKDSMVLKESSAAYQLRTMQGECTLNDYYALPDGRRAELSDGVIYDMAAPNNLHQQISMEIVA